MPRPVGIVLGGKVSRGKRQLALDFRHSMTPQEAALWERLRKNRLNGFHFRRQQIIEGFLVDFYHHASGLAVEVDGDVHDSQREYDAERGLVLGSRGIRVLRIRNVEIESDIEEVLRRILGACDPT